MAANAGLPKAHLWVDRDPGEQLVAVHVNSGQRVRHEDNLASRLRVAPPGSRYESPDPASQSNVLNSSKLEQRESEGHEEGPPAIAERPFKVAPPWLVRGSGEPC